MACSDDHPVWKDRRSIRVVQTLEIVVSFSNKGRVGSHIEDTLPWSTPGTPKRVLYQLWPWYSAEGWNTRFTDGSCTEATDDKRFASIITEMTPLSETSDGEG